MSRSLLRFLDKLEMTMAATDKRASSLRRLRKRGFIPARYFGGGLSPSAQYDAVFLPHLFTFHYYLLTKKTPFVPIYIRTNGEFILSVVPPKLLQSSHFESEFSYCRTATLLPAARGWGDLLPRVLRMGACCGTYTTFRSLKTAFRCYSLVHSKNLSCGQP